MPSIRPRVQRHAPGQDIAAEQGLVGRVDLAGAAAPHMLFEGVDGCPAASAVSRATSDGFFRQKRVEQGFALPGGVEAPLDAEPLDQLVEAEARADDADRAEERGLLAEDLVAGERQPIAARCGHILGKGDDRHALFLGKLADAAVEQRRLHRRAARRIDDDSDGDEARDTRNASLDRRRVARQRHATAPLPRA